jgi:hypothetical protein
MKPKENLGTLRQICVALTLLLSFSLISNAQESPGEALTSETMMHFVSAERGRELIAEDDRFIQQVQPLERQIRLESETAVTKHEYLESLKVGVRQWSADEVSSVRTSIQELGKKFTKYKLPLPSRIHLIRVSSKVEANSPHCRGASIVLPDSFFRNSKQMSRILSHELFHVLSSHNPALRDRLYSIIGFTPCNEIGWPSQLQGRRITNPDAPVNRHLIKLAVSSRKEKVAMVPITMCKSDEYFPGGLFRNLDFKLLELEDKEGKLVPKVVNGTLQMHDPNQTPDYLRQIGQNTGYIIHPEETLADNFTLLLFESSNVRDPWVLDKMSEVLLK